MPRSKYADTGFWVGLLSISAGTALASILSSIAFRGKPVTMRIPCNQRTNPGRTSCLKGRLSVRWLGVSSGRWAMAMMRIFGPERSRGSSISLRKNRRLRFFPRVVVARAAHETIEAVIDPTTGELSSKKTESGNVLLVPGVWLTLGEWKVTFRLTIGTIAPIETIVVIADHADHPLDLFTYQPYVPPAESEVTTLLVPSGHFDGAVLGYQAGALKWLPGVEAIQDAVAWAEEVAAEEVLNLVDVGQHLYSPNASVSGALDLTSFEKKAIIHRTLTGNITEVFLPRPLFRVLS